MTYQRSGPGRFDQTHGRPSMPWQDAVDLFLINGGLSGKSQTELILRFKSSVDTEQLKAYIDALWIEGKIERFQVMHKSGQGKPRTVWRATTKMMEP